MNHTSSPWTATTRTAEWLWTTRSATSFMPWVSSTTGATLSIGDGVYHEVVIEDKNRILIQSAPGQQAVIDGSIPAFSDTPAEAWNPRDTPGEFVSVDSHPDATRCPP